jgi:hypothetical protein
VDRIQLAQDRTEWWALVKTVMNLWVYMKDGELTGYLRDLQLLKKDSAPWSEQTQRRERTVRSLNLESQSSAQEACSLDRRYVPPHSSQTLN